jgi:signal transduction histidine kinase
VLDADEVSDSFTRFHRRDGRRNPYGGAGLGLAIVESSVRTHGGTISAAARTAGGMEVEVRLPAAVGT